MTNPQFTFMCEDDRLSDAQAKAVLKAQPDLKLVDCFSKTFLVEAGQSAADAFAAANAAWKVSPVVKFKLPDTSFKIIKPPSQD